MPGATIGTELNPTSELVWDGRITILKVGTDYKVQYQYERGDANVDNLIREQIAELVKSLAR